MKRILLSLIACCGLAVAQTANSNYPQSALNPAFAADTGTATAYVVTLSPCPVSLQTGMEMSFNPGNANTTTTPTLNVCGFGAKTITKLGNTALVANDLVTTAQAVVRYDGTDWELQNPNTVSGGGGGISGLTAAQPVFGPTSSTLQSSPGWYYASNPSYAVGDGGDYCKLWNNALAAIPAGSWLFWDIPGKLECASNFSNGLTPVGTTFITVPVSFWTNTGQVQPPHYNVYGVGESKNAEDGTQGSSFVACPVTSAVCTSVFPNDTALWAVESGSPSANFSAAGTGTQLWWMTLNCAYVQGCRSYMNYYGQEQSGTHHVTFRNAENNGVEVDLGQSTVSGDSDNSNYEGINAGATTAPTGATAACTYGALVVRLNYPLSGDPGPKSIKDVTANHLQCQSLSTPLIPNHAVEVNGCCTDWEGKLHTEDTGPSALVFGTRTLLGSASTSGTTVTYVSGDDWAASCSGTIYIANVPYTVSTCTSGTSLVLTSSAGTQTAAPYSLDTHAGASNQKIESSDHCCSANGTVNTSGTTITFATGAAPQVAWTGNILVNNASYLLSSCTTTTCTTTTSLGTQTGVSYSYGSMFGIDGASTTNAISILNFKALSPSPPSMMMLDGFNSTISKAAAGNMACYTIDHNDNVVCDDSGINAVNQTGGDVISTLSGSTTDPFTATAQGTTNGVQMNTAGLLQAIGSGGINATECNGASCAGGGFSPTLTSPATTQTLTYNGTAWVNGYGGVNVDPQTGNYTFSCPTDRLGEIEFNISSAATLTLPQAGSTACLGSTLALVVRNTGTSTAVLTVAATTSLFEPEASASHTILPDAGLFIYSDNTNYHALIVPVEFGRVNVKTTGYTLMATDQNRLVVMNCSSACVATLPATPPNSIWDAWVISIGSTLATVSLNSLNFNGVGTAPTLTTGHSLQIRTDGTNYFGDISSGGSGGSNFSVNGGSTITSPNLNGTTPAAATNFLNATVQQSTNSVSVEVPISGTGTSLCSTTGTLTSGDLVSFDASGNCKDSGIATPAASSTVGVGGIWSNGAPLGNGPTLGTVAPILNTMYGSQLTIATPATIGHATLDVATAGTGSVVGYACLYNSSGSTLLWSTSFTIGTGTGVFTGSATQYTALPGTYLVTFEQTGTTAASYESYGATAAITNILNKNAPGGSGNPGRFYTTANTESGSACPSSTGTLTDLSSIAGPVLIALEP